jgi:hypothetical protein
MTPSSTDYYAWRPWFAWRPVSDQQGRWHWLTHLYRRRQPPDRVLREQMRLYDYSTLFDLVRDP